MSRVIFLLGAGASADAGLPLMADLTTGFRNALESEPMPDRDLLLTAFDAAAASARRGDGVPNIERVLQLLADVAELKSGAGAAVVNEWTDAFRLDAADLERLGANARRYIRNTLSEVESEDSDYLHGLLDFQDDEPVDVFTLNYDRLVEDVAVRFDVRHATGFAEAWDPTLFDLPGLQLRLYKLHGSVDWFRLVRRNVVFRGTPEHPAFRSEASTEVLLYPTGSKTAFGDPFATLVSRFSDALAKAKYCVAIGYSFRDAHIRRIVLDRLATSRELQLLVVDPQAEAVLELKPDELGEPTFGQMGHRVSGLWQTARYALENRTIGHRLEEIRDADASFLRAVQYRNARQFGEAANAFLRCVDNCRKRHLPHKPEPFVREPLGRELREHLTSAIAQRISNQANTLRIPVGDEPRDDWKNMGAESMALSVSQHVSDWLVAAALGLTTAVEGTREALKAVLARYAGGLLFVLGKSWRVWGTPYPVRHATEDLGVRSEQLKACIEHLAEYPPVTGLLLAQDKTAAEEYDAFHLGMRELGKVHQFLLGHSVVVRKVFGAADVFIPDVPNWPDPVSAVSKGFLKSGAPKIWLGAPSHSGKQ